MRRKDREITDFDEIADVLARCDVLHIAMNGDGCPYIAATNFGMEAKDGRVTLYIHSAKEGEKLARIEKDNRVCVQAEIDLGTQRTPGGITNRYESIVGRGAASIVEDEDERVHSLTLINRHYGYGDLPGDCKSLPATVVIRIDVQEITGKRNLPVT